jgi:hypothetical protein
MFILKGTFAKEIESLVYSPIFTNLVVTLEPENDKDPGPDWFQAVAAYSLVPLCTIENIIYILDRLQQ